MCWLCKCAALDMFNVVASSLCYSSGYSSHFKILSLFVFIYFCVAIMDQITHQQLFKFINYSVHGRRSTSIFLSLSSFRTQAAVGWCGEDTLTDIYESISMILLPATSSWTQKHVLCKTHGSFCRIIYARSEIHYSASMGWFHFFCVALGCEFSF